MAGAARQCWSFALQLLAVLAFATLHAAPLHAQTVWVNPANGTWATGANWSAGVPGPSIDALINATGAAYTVSHSGGTINAQTLSINSADATLALSGGAILN
ncbi:MAG: hypothetical protein JNK75_02020, partial [Betaproteobacteria bacterium]|nr:hypothetical protein [Betaproteobacteria bacterium]